MAAYLRCLFIARPLDAGDGSSDFVASAAFPITSSTTAEDMVRSTLRHVTTKLEATLLCPPQQLVVLLRRTVDGQTVYTRLPLPAKLGVAEGVVAQILLVRPNKEEKDIERLTQPMRSANSPPQTFAPPYQQRLGFASFVRLPSTKMLDTAIDDEGPVDEDEASRVPVRGRSPGALEATSSSSFRRGEHAPSPTFIQHASATLLKRASSSEQVTEGAAPAVPLTLVVVHYTMFGDRIEVEIPYMSTELAQAVVGRAASEVASRMRYPFSADDRRRLGLVYRRKDGTDRVFAPDEPLPLPKAAGRTPTAFLARLPNAAEEGATPPTMHRTRSPQKWAEPAPVNARSTPQQQERLPRVDSGLPASLQPDDHGARDECREARDEIAALYRSVHGDLKRAKEAAAKQQAAETERADLLRARSHVQERWTECASVAKDIERLSEQVSWFEREIAEQRERESSLRLKLHKLQSEGRFAGSTP
jgi:hypothetical protein